MRKMITCSFDPSGVVITAWNGVHPDRPGHFSVTKMMSREDYNDRHLFNDVLGIKIHEGWAQALSDATKNASNLKIDPKAGLNILMNAIIMKHGPEKAKELFEKLEKENVDMQAALEAELSKDIDNAVDVAAKEVQTQSQPKGTDDGTNDRATDAGKGSKKSRRAAADETPNA